MFVVQLFRLCLSTFVVHCVSCAFLCFIILVVLVVHLYILLLIMTSNSNDRPQLSISSEVVHRIVSGAVSNAISALQQDTSTRQGQGPASGLLTPQPTVPRSQQLEQESDEDDFTPRKRKRYRSCLLAT